MQYHIFSQIDADRWKKISARAIVVKEIRITKDVPIHCRKFLCPATKPQLYDVSCSNLKMEKVDTPSQSPIELPTSLITARTLIFLTLLITSTVDLKLMVTIFDWFLCSINPDVIDFETWVLTVLQGLGQNLKSWNIGPTKERNYLQHKQMWRKKQFT